MCIIGTVDRQFYLTKKEQVMKEGLKITQSFYIDHIERDCEAPEILHQTKNHFWISTEKGDAWNDLYSDAVLYEDAQFFDHGCLGLCLSARALVKAMDSVMDPADRY